jgi:hypothetical protein
MACRKGRRILHSPLTPNHMIECWLVSLAPVFLRCFYNLETGGIRRLKGGELCRPEIRVLIPVKY